MLTRLVRTQLIIFTIAGVIGVTAMVGVYMQAPTLLGIGRITVMLELPATGGLYRFSNVTYRGVDVGKVTAVRLVPGGTEATLSLNTSPKIPADLQAQVRSISAVGEQYVELRPRTDSGPYLQDGSVIAKRDTTIPQKVGPMLDQVNALLGSIPKEKLGALLDESFKGFNGAGYDLGSLFDSAARIAGDANSISDRTRAFIDDGAPLLDSQAQAAESIRIWARSLAGITEQLVTNDPQVRKLVQSGPGAVDEVSRLLNQIKPTLPVLLANLTSVGQVTMTYHASLEQILVLLPPYVAATQSYYLPTHNPTGLPVSDAALGISDPAACTVGFLPPAQWRSPADTTTIDTPDGLYCKLPQDSPIAVRGARNYPCIGHPGKRAPTVELCNSDKPYEPLAMRQHALGPYPFDPNLIAQGIPPDERANMDAGTYGPIAGTPLPAEAPGPGKQGQAPSAGMSPPAPTDGAQAAPVTDGATGAVAPSSFVPNGSERGPSVAIVQYDPRTGRYVGPDGKRYRQSDVVASSTPKTWKDMFGF